MPIALPIALGAAQLWGSMANNASQREQQKQQGLMRAAEIRASPWTKMGPETKVEFAPSQGSAVAQGLVGGAASGIAQSQAMSKAASDEEFQKALMKKWLAPKQIVGADIPSEEIQQATLMGKYRPTMET